jgi:hypothetical protein
MNNIKLSDGQVSVLKLLYRYRYGSIDLLRTSLKMKNNSGLYQKLEVLIKHKYVGKQYKKEYRLIGFPAAYFLLPKAYKLLSQQYDYDIPETVVKASYRDNNRSDRFISHMLQIYTASTELARLYPGIKFYSSREILGYESFPDNLPDGYLSLDTGNATRRYFLDIISEDTPRYVINKLVSDYHEFFLEDTWSSTGSDLPALLIIAEGGKSEKYLQKLLRSRQDVIDMTEPRFYTSTLKALKGSTKESNNIWSEVSSPEDPLPLSDAV